MTLFSKLRNYLQKNKNIGQIKKLARLDGLAIEPVLPESLRNAVDFIQFSKFMPSSIWRRPEGGFVLTYGVANKRVRVEFFNSGSVTLLPFFTDQNDELMGMYAERKEEIELVLERFLN